MIKERKRDPKEWHIKAYKFRAYPNGELPKMLWDIAVEQRRLWNEFCLIRDKYSFEIKHIKDNSSLDQEYIKDKTIDLYKLMDREILAAGKASRLDWSCYSELINRFQAARRKGATNLKYGLKEVNIAHVITKGGMTVDQVFTNKNLARVIRPLDPKVYSNDSYFNIRQRYSKGQFRIAFDGQIDTIHYRINLQQEIDPRSFIKRINWVGRYSVLGWEWHLVLTLEEPAKSKLISNSGVAAIDTGWRKLDNYIRVGLLVDQHGRVVEFRLPLNVQDKYTKSKDRKGKLNNFDHKDRIKWLSDTWDYQREIDELLEDTKIQIKPFLSLLRSVLPEDHYLNSKIDHFSRIRSIGLNKIFNYLKDPGNAFLASYPNDYKDMVNILAYWQKRSLYMRRTLYGIQRRIAVRRKEIYLNMAHWIFRNYGELVWEADLKVKEMSEDKDLSPALQNAAKYRQYAAPGSFRETVKRIQGKYNAIIHPVKAKNTTAICAVCGNKIKTGPKLILECEQGHKLDQDINAMLRIGQGFYGDIFAYDKISTNLGKKIGQEQIVVVKNHKDYIVHLEL